mgnify:CR=1 FL=1
MAENSFSCNTSNLDLYVPSGDNPWSEGSVKHCYRRLGYGADLIKINAGLSISPSNLIDEIVDSAVNMPLRQDPPWAYYRLSDFGDPSTENPEYINSFRIETGTFNVYNELKGRIIFFWLNHFVTELGTYNYAPYLFQYYRTAELHALGNFKTLVHEMGLTPAMLLYLNGYQNTNTEPNENYARELFELFTLGEGNGYTQEDIYHEGFNKLQGPETDKNTINKFMDDLKKFKKSTMNIINYTKTNDMIKINVDAVKYDFKFDNIFPINTPEYIGKIKII